MVLGADGKCPLRICNYLVNNLHPEGGRPNYRLISLSQLACIPGDALLYVVLGHRGGTGGAVSRWRLWYQGWCWL